MKPKEKAMRKIKFRAFFKADERICEVTSIDFANKEATLWDKETAVNFEASFEDIKLLQYTGANDKHGVEIYEGDIVKFESSVPIPEGPDYPKEGQIGVVKYGFCDYYVDAKSLCGFNLDELGDWIVVGNIYENPELLKDR